MPPVCLSEHGLYITPVCLPDLGGSSHLHDVTIFSLKLGVRMCDPAASGAEVSVLLVSSQDRVIYEANFRLASSQRPVLSFQVPGHILETGIITAYLVLCAGENGSISDIVDSGKLLVFPSEASREVKAVFQSFMSNAERFLTQERASQAAAGSHHPEQPSADRQPLPPRQWQSMTSALMSAPTSEQHQAMQQLSRSAPSVLCFLQGTARRQAAGAGSSHRTGRVADPNPPLPDAASLYAYEHFLMPFVRHWATVMYHDNTSALQANSSQSTTVAATSLAVRLLHFLLDNEMWACAVLLLGKFPDVAERVLQSGLELPADFTDPIILQRLRASLPTQAVAAVLPLHQDQQHEQQQQQQREQQQQQQQHEQQQQREQQQQQQKCEQQQQGQWQQQGWQQQEERQQQQHEEEPQQQQHGAAAVEEPDAWDRALPAGLQLQETDGSDSSQESADEILRRLGVLQQQRAEQEALQDFLQDPVSSAVIEAASWEEHTDGATSAKTCSKRSGGAAAATKGLHSGSSSSSSSTLAAGQPQSSARSVAHQQVPDRSTARLTKSASGCAASVAPLQDGLSSSSAPALLLGAEDGQQQPQQHEQQQLRSTSSDRQGGNRNEAGLCPDLPARTCSVVSKAAVAGAAAHTVQLPVTCTASKSNSSSSNLVGVSVQSKVGQGKATEDLLGAFCAPGNPSRKLETAGGKLQQAAYSSAEQEQMQAWVWDVRALAQVAVRGFHDDCLEQSYLVFKNHSCHLLDTTASLICSGMLLASIFRTFDPSEMQAWPKLAVLVVYGLVFFFPYMLQQCRQQLFLRQREQLIVLARALTAGFLCLVAMQLLPQPNAWVVAVTKTLALQLQNSFILPCCQQLRMPAAAAITAVHVPSDMLMLGIGMPLSTALLHSCLIAVGSLLTSLLLDIHCRWRFVMRYPGAAGWGGNGPPAGATGQGLAGKGRKGTPATFRTSAAGVACTIGDWAATSSHGKQA